MTEEQNGVTQLQTFLPDQIHSSLSSLKDDITENGLTWRQFFKGIAENSAIKQTIEEELEEKYKEQE